MRRMQRDKGCVDDLSIFILGEFTEQYEMALKIMKDLSHKAAKYGVSLEQIRSVNYERKKVVINSITDEKVFYENQINILNGK